jgi:hypothetical protein
MPYLGAIKDNISDAEGCGLFSDKKLGSVSASLRAVGVSGGR